MKNILLVAVSLALLAILALALLPIMAPNFPFPGDDQKGPFDGYATAEDFAQHRASIEAIGKFMAAYRPGDADLSLRVESGALTESVPGSETLARTRCEKCLLPDGTPLVRAFVDSAVSAAYRSRDGEKLTLLKDVDHRRFADRRKANEYVYSFSGAPSPQAVALTGGWYLVTGR